MYEGKVVYATVRIVVDKDADIQDVMDECDYSFDYEDQILTTQLVDFTYDPEDMP